MRFLPHTDSDRAQMLARIGVADISALFADIPSQFHLRPEALNLPAAQHETAIQRSFAKAAAANRNGSDHRYFLGGGTYHHFIPAAVDYIISRGEFLTAYTPYQPEISQGTLQSLFEFQTMVARLTGMEVANASMYDAATSVAEAALMARRVTRRKQIVAATSVNPRYREVCRNYLSRLDGDYTEVTCEGYTTDIAALCAAVDGSTAAVIVQFPDFYGSLYDLAPLRAACDQHGALLVLAFSDASAFALIESPGALGADIAVGSGQALGIPMGYGGPHIGLFTCKKKLVRQLPGRVCGQTLDADGKRSFVLTLSTREQHIRREKATSNICSNQGLMCTAVAVYLSLLGDAGLHSVAQRSAAALAQLIAGLPSSVHATEGAHYNETVLCFPDPDSRDRVLAKALAHNIFAGIPLERIEQGADRAALLVATSEMVEPEDIVQYLEVLNTAA
ncbi:MAG: aminomethyl-transferring glycine dehydrogenase subunit GcvPA [Mariprofundales bacterium]|nr:aminomethyl-transferring glycine dehydrogenase subunit GcvPA [Mariprofundales bacterium]